MYDDMEEAGVTTRLAEHVWMDRAENIVEEGNMIGYKVTYNITRLDMIVVGDEVGGNISIRSDGYVWGV